MTDKSDIVTINEGLVKAVTRAIADTSTFTANESMLQLLGDKSGLLELGGDINVDIQRLPIEVTNLDTFFQYIISIKKEIHSWNQKGGKIERDRANEIQGTVPDYMLNGKLKLLKTSMCLCMLLRRYQSNNDGKLPTGTLDAVANQLMGDGASNVPDNLPKGAAILWKNVFGDSKARTKSLLVLILSWCRVA
jgi:hypothetical protein